MANWYILRNDKEHGPFDDQQLKKLALTGKVKPNDLVRREDSKSLRLAKDIKGLIPPVIPTPDPQETPPPLPATNFALWNPATVRVAAFFLTWAFGAFLTAKNWTALGEPDKAKRSMIWFYCLIPFVLLALVFLDESNVSGFQAIGVIAFIAWAFSDSESQLKYIKQKFGSDYPKKSLLPPIGAAVGCLFVFAAISANLQTTAQPIASPQAISLPTVHAESQPQEQSIPPNSPASAPATTPDLTLANGRVPMKEFLEFVKRREGLKLSTSESGERVAGTPFEFLSDSVGEPSRMHIGGRDEFGQHVSAILMETERNHQIAAVLLGTPLNLNAPVKRGNDLNSLIIFVNTILPEADIRKLFNEQTVTLMSGGDVTAQFGKAAISATYDKRGKEMRVIILIDQ